MKFDDSGKQDDKLIAVIPDNGFGSVSSLAELNAKYNGVTGILETWFYNYKGPGAMLFKGFGDAAEARSILDAAAKGFK